MISGSITSFNNNSISGVIHKTIKNDVSVEIHLIIDGITIDVQKIIFANDYHKFSFRSGDELNIIFNIRRVKIKVNNYILPFHNSLKNKIIYIDNYLKTQIRKQFLFLHIPKTAGTTIRNVLYLHYNQESIFPNKRDIKFHSGYPTENFIKKNSFKKLNNSDLITGHYSYDVSNYFIRMPVIFTVLRDPIERALSHLFHIKRHAVGFSDMSLEEILEKAETQISNIQTRYISGTSSFEISEVDCEQAKFNMSKMTLVGSQNNLEDFFKKLFKLVDMPTRIIPVMNSNPDRNKYLKVNSDLLENLKQINKYDIELFNLVKNRD